MQFGAIEPKSTTARKLNELVKRVEELEAALAGKTEEKSTKKTSKKTEEKVEESAE